MFESILGYLPQPLLALGPRGLRWWQWVALVVVFGVAWMLGLIAGRLSRAGLSALARRTTFQIDDAIVPQLRGPLTVGWAVVIAQPLLGLLHLPATASARLHRALMTLLFAGFFWLLWRTVAITRTYFERSTWASRNPSSRSLLPLGGRVAQVMVLAIGLVAVLAQLGYPVASLVAGLGIGGLALALAAQKTVENLFGAFALSLDQPFVQGDGIKVDGVEGTVEVIGLRSTRLRTADRTLVTIPNGKLADMRIESMAARDRLRFGATFRLVLGTTAAQLRDVLAGWEQVLRAQPTMVQNPTVKFKEIGASSLDIEVGVYFNTTNNDEFMAIRQEVLLGFIAVVEKAGTAFAVPTQTLRVEGDVPAAAP